MNTLLNNGHDDLRFAEYVLGVLDTDARAAVEQEIRDDLHAAAAVQWWQERLTPFSEDVADSVPPDYVWARIQDVLGQSVTVPVASPTPGPAGSLWDSLMLWRGFAIGAAAVAVACIIALIVVPRATVTKPATPTIAYMASTITETNGQVGWTATMDLRHARMVVVPAKPQAIPAGRAPELWLIPAGHKPIAVGMIAANKPTTIALPPALLARLGPTAALAVSIEPPGGSPTGQPTGPVVGKGSIGAAQTAGGKPVAIRHASLSERDTT